MNSRLCALCFGLLSLSAFAQSSATESPTAGKAGKEETFGAATMPPTLPPGSASAYGFVGAQEVGGGYRQGTGAVEIEGRGHFNYLELSFGAEAHLKFHLLKREKLEVAPSIGVGLGFDTGSRYFDQRNFKALLLRVEPGIVAGYRVHETLRAYALADVPWDIGISPTGGYRLQALVGGGVEFYLGDDLSIFGQGAIGPDVMREPFGLAEWQIGYSVKVGLGYRLF